ncbi:MAG: RNA pseudouridine synthase, partial [Oscillospiraceae bacterium]|nr:RNA pseudouridine synthase [Oscillospiraceae bacterium]
LKQYLAVVHGAPEPPSGAMEDLLLRDRVRRMTIVVSEPVKGAKPARLEYETLCRGQEMTLLRITLLTGRTHQIRVQLSSRGIPIVGDRKYGVHDGAGHIALWSHRLRFAHPQSGEEIDFTLPPPDIYPWTLFPKNLYKNRLIPIAKT